MFSVSQTAPPGSPRLAPHGIRHTQAQRAIRLRIGRAIRAAANRLAFTVARQNPLGHIPAEIVDRLFILFTLATEAPHFRQ